MSLHPAAAEESDGEEGQETASSLPFPDVRAAAVDATPTPSAATSAQAVLAAGGVTNEEVDSKVAASPLLQLARQNLLLKSALARSESKARVLAERVVELETQIKQLQRQQPTTPAATTTPAAAAAAATTATATATTPTVERMSEAEEEARICSVMEQLCDTMCVSLRLSRAGASSGAASEGTTLSSLPQDTATVAALPGHTVKLRRTQVRLAVCEVNGVLHAKLDDGSHVPLEEYAANQIRTGADVCVCVRAKPPSLPSHCKLGCLLHHSGPRVSASLFLSCLS